MANKDWNVLVEDDASRYLDSLTQEERRPVYRPSEPPKGSTDFTPEEIEIAFDGFCPKV